MNKIAQLRHSCGFWIGVLLAAVAFLVGPTAANPLEKEMTFTVEAGRNDCFYQAVAMGETIDLEYQVIAYIFLLEVNRSFFFRTALN